MDGFMVGGDDAIKQGSHLIFHSPCCIVDWGTHNVSLVGFYGLKTDLVSIINLSLCLVICTIKISEVEKDRKLSIVVHVDNLGSVIEI